MTGSGSAKPHPGHTRSASGSSFVSIAPKAINKLVLPLIILLTIVLASAGQTEVAHYLSANIGYHQPYFTFFLTHITFALVFPLHLLCLLLFHRRPLHHYLDGLRHIIAEQLGDSTSTWREVAPKWSAKVTWLTTLVSVPALSWFVAMNLTTGLAVTTIYATSAFWTYLFSMVLLKQPLSRITVGSIGLAFAGVIVLSLDGLKGETTGAPNPLLGDIIMMFGTRPCVNE
jgi:drug/metabolite transporter (DMT)-like permease